MVDEPIPEDIIEEPVEEAAVEVEPKPEYHLVLVSSGEVPQVMEFVSQEDFFRAFESLLQHYTGSGTYVFAFHGSRVYHTEAQSVVGIDMADGSPIVPVIIKEPKRNLTGLVPGSTV